MAATNVAHRWHVTMCFSTKRKTFKPASLTLGRCFYHCSAALGVNISYEQSIGHLEKCFPGKGEEYASKLRDYTIALYKKCADYALEKGIIIADTKFEFGLDENGNIVLGDEMLTPDSSRFWPADGYEPGHSQPSFDKQFARDWLKANPDNDWTLPDEIVEKTIEKYLQAYEMLTGKKL